MADTKRPEQLQKTARSVDGPRARALEETEVDSERWESEPVPDLGRTRPLGSMAGASPFAAAPDTPATKGTPPRAAGKSIELFVVDESQLPGGERRPWRAAEVWTKRRIYGLDSTFRCIEILDRESGRPEAGHDMLGARLGGGRLRERDTVRFSYPLPLPGMEAMFMKDKKHGYTSTVERMIVRIRVLHTSIDETPPTWEEIASRWSEPPR